MLAEINFLRLEAIARAQREVVPAPAHQFVAIGVAVATAPGDRHTAGATSVAPATGDGRRGSPR
jgi:hypothetical protein